MTRADQNPRFQASVISLLLDQTGFALLAVFVNALVYTYLSWTYVNQTWLLTWLGAVYVISLSRLYFYRQWQARKAQMEVHDLLQLRRKITAGIAISGMLWGVLGVFGLISHSPTHLSITTFILAGMSAGAVGAYSGSLRLIYTFLFLGLSPFIMGLFFEGSSEYRFMGLMCGLYLILMALIARTVNKQTLQAVTLAFEKQDLLDQLNDASHEIRTPVSAICGITDLLVKSEVPPQDVAHMHKIIHRNSQYLLSLVENVLQFGTKNSYIDQERKLVTLSDEIADAVAVVEKRLSAKGLKLSVEIPSQMPQRFIMNHLRFQQILINFLNNAVKFTETGTIVIRAGFKEPYLLTIQVSDTGIGISPEATSRLFQPFFRETRSEVKNQEGSGLGLALAQNLARRLGGDARLVRSSIGHGSTFEFSIKVEVPHAAGQTRRLQGVQVVLVDDSEDILFLYRKQLEAEGARVATCNHGRSAVEFLSTAPSTDLVLMDLNMPVMDGYTAASEIRSNGYRKPILALTAYDSEESRAKCLRSGFDNCLSKNLTFSELLQVLEKHVASENKKRGSLRPPQSDSN